MHLESCMKELEAYYATTPDVSAIRDELNHTARSLASPSPVVLRCLVYNRIATRCDVHIFRHLPFFCEIRSGRARHAWGFGPLGQWVRNRAPDQWITPYAQRVKPYNDAAIIIGSGAVTPISEDHHCLGYDNILRLGSRGIMAQARNRLASAEPPSHRAFLEAVIAGHEALITLAEKFSARAAEMARGEADTQVRDNLLRIATAAARIPADPPRTFHEALNCILFCREAIGTLEGLGISTFGQLDRMLWPYYQADLAAGRITPDQASDWLCALLAYTDAKWGFRLRLPNTETSTTIIIGGCDAEGRHVYNDITRMIIEAYRRHRFVGTKLNARISSAHPDEYFHDLARLTQSGANVLAMLNDDVLIEANVRQGKSLADSRLYVAGGCQEIVLANTEVNSRAYSWLNLPKVLLMTLGVAKPVGVIRHHDSFADFDELYRAVMANIRAVLDDFASAVCEYERRWRDYDAHPLYSSTLDDCIATATDITAGGARYDSTAVSMVGFATFVDALYATQQAVYQDRRVSLDELKRNLANGTAADASLRHYLKRRIAKFGGEDPQHHRFTQRVLDGLAAFGGQPNGRGGRFAPTFFSYSTFMDLGAATGATPDGREAARPLSRAFSPSDFANPGQITPVINSLRGLDLARFPESGVTEITLPLSPNDDRPDPIASIIRVFITAGGAALQFNVVDTAKLEDAIAHPSNHTQIVVRVCGYSAYFTALDRKLQEQILERMVMRDHGR